MIRAGILIISDRCARGEMRDVTGPVLEEELKRHRIEVVRIRYVADEQLDILEWLREMADHDQLSLILTAGGTGLGPRDVTPEATRVVLEREATGLAEFLRQQTASSNAMSALSRGTAGVRGKTLIVNLPGSPNGAVEWFQHLVPLLEHALQMIEGKGHGSLAELVVGS